MVDYNNYLYMKRYKFIPIKYHLTLIIVFYFCIIFFVVLNSSS